MSKYDITADQAEEVLLKAAEYGAYYEEQYDTRDAVEKATEILAFAIDAIKNDISSDDPDPTVRRAAHQIEELLAIAGINASRL